MRLSLLLGLFACAPADMSPVWAVQHGSLVVADDGASVEGYQVWDFFAEGWEKQGDQRYHVCARVQSLGGFLESTLPEDCDDCLGGYAITLEELETDCESPVDDAQDYAGMSRFAVGDLPREFEVGDPHPGESLGFYAAWGDEDVAPLGYVWNEALDLDEAPADDGWAPGERYVYEAASAWAL